MRSCYYFCSGKDAGLGYDDAARWQLPLLDDLLIRTADTLLSALTANDLGEDLLPEIDATSGSTMCLTSTDMNGS